jgi:pimeloyl-ACP methyl ester carboxylesterase
VPDRLLRVLAARVCTEIARRRGCAPARDTLAAAASSAIATTSLATALGFLPALRNYDAYPVLSAVVARTIIVSGGADALTPPSHAEDLADGITGAVHMHLPDAGHMLTHDAPRAITNAVIRASNVPAALPLSIQPTTALVGA